MTLDEILADYKDLEKEDILAAPTVNQTCILRNKLSCLAFNDLFGVARQ
jgi:uncharacterized protein (DUF433 family)